MNEKSKQMNKKHIMVIGAGQLGSRHLQALAISKLNLEVTVIDPSEDSLRIAKERYEQIEKSEGTKSIQYHQSISSVEKIVDLCVLATNADCRLAVLKELVAQVSVKNIVFEKVLFQSCAQMAEAQNILLKHNINAWVNCPRRMQMIYRKLKDLLKNEAYIELTVSGSNWGLACNAIHMIDLWAYLTNQSSYKIDTESLLPTLFDSKRKNFMELGGTLKGAAGMNKISMSCDINDGNATILHSIKTPRYSVKIDEAAGKCEIKDLEKQEQSTIDFKILFQSQLTHIVTEDIITKGCCDLTTFSESAELHRPFLMAVLEFMNKHGQTKYNVCPIT